MRQNIPQDLLARVVKAVEQGNYFLSLHADLRRQQRLISAIGIRLVVLGGQAIEFDPADTNRGDGLLFCGKDELEIVWHVKIAEIVEEKYRYLVITVYRPDSISWEDGFTIRRRRLA
jgi:hypothetical protein